MLYNKYNICTVYSGRAAGERARTADRGGGVMFQNGSKVLLILPQDILDRARVLAGKATAALKLPVSLQIVLRALIGEGLKRDGDRNLLTNIEVQALAIRRIRSLAGKGGKTETERQTLRPEILRRPSGRQY
jgi:hypothetical protein